MWSTLIAVSVLGVIVEAAKPRHLPSYIPTCNKDAPDFDACVLTSARQVLPNIINGDKSLAIPSFKPLKLEQVEMNSGNLKIKLVDVGIWGLAKAEIKAFKFDLEAKRIDLNFSCAQVVLLGKYNLKGKLSIINLEGEGNTNITLDNPDFTFTANYDLVQKDNFDYIKLKETVLDYTMTRVYFKFENLFNGNEQLSKSTHDVMNTEWRSISRELGPAIRKTIESIASLIINGVASRVPYQYMFI